MRRFIAIISIVVVCAPVFSQPVEYRRNYYNNGAMDMILKWSAILDSLDTKADTLYIEYGCDLELESGILVSGDTINIDTCFIPAGGGSLWDLIHGHLEPKNDIDSAFVKIIRTDTILSLSQYMDVDCYFTDSAYYNRGGGYFDTLTWGTRNGWASTGIMMYDSGYSIKVGDSVVVGFRYPLIDSCACCPDPFPMGDSCLVYDTIYSTRMGIHYIDSTVNHVIYWVIGELNESGLTCMGCYFEDDAISYVSAEFFYHQCDTAYTDYPVVVDEQFVMTDSVYLYQDKIPLLQSGDPLPGFLTLKKLGVGSKRQLALSSIQNAIDTLIAYGLDTSLWYFDGSSIRNKLTSDVHIDTALTLTGLKAMLVAANDQFILVLDSVSGNVYRTKLTSFIDTLALLGMDTTLWYLSGDTTIIKNSHKVYMNDSVYLNGYAIPMMQSGDPLAGFLTIKKLGSGGIRQLALSSIQNAIDTLMVYGIGHWDKNGNFLFPREYLTDSVGIGTNTPTERLDVEGNINIPATAADGSEGIIKQGGAPLLHTYTNNVDYPNLWIGGAGNLTTTNGFNIGIGFESLKANTSGQENTAMGWWSLQINTTGRNNTAIGSGAMAENVSGQYNAAFGDGALYANTGNYNTGLGSGAGLNNTSGTHNTWSGRHAGYNNTTGGYNTVLGSGALFYNRGNIGTVAIGYQAMYYADNRTSGRITYNTAVGYEAMRGSTTAANNTGRYNTAMGYQALDAMTSGSNNTAIGFNTLSAITTGSYSTAVGSQALELNTSGEYNTAVGWSALGGNTTGSYNAAFGKYALGYNLSGQNNSAFGNNALEINYTGGYNTAMGASVMTSNLSGGYNTAYGAEALAATTASNNTAVGFQAGWSGTGASFTGNVFLGYKAGYPETGGNKLYIENSNSATPLIWGDFNLDSLVINGDLTITGNVLYTNTHWDDMTVSATAAKIGANNKPVYNYDSLALRWDDNDSTTNYLVFNYQLKHSYAPGTDLYPHIHYQQKSAADTALFWIIHYRWTNVGEAQSPTFTRIQTIDETIMPYTGGSMHQIAEFPAIDGTGKAESSILDIRLYCWAAQDMYTKEFDIHFQINKPGTYDEYTP